MTIHTRAPMKLDNPPIPVQVKLAAAWTSLMFLIIYIDYFHLYQPGEIDEIRSGRIFAFDISRALMSIFFVIIAIPTLMILLSVMLPARANRITNLVAASVNVPLMVFNFVGSPSGWSFYYALTIGVEVLILAFILRSAWKWTPTSATSTVPVKTDVR